MFSRSRYCTAPAFVAGAILATSVATQRFCRRPEGLHRQFQEIIR